MYLAKYLSSNRIVVSFDSHVGLRRLPSYDRPSAARVPQACPINIMVILRTRKIKSNLENSLFFTLFYNKFDDVGILPPVFEIYSSVR